MRTRETYKDGVLISTENIQESFIPFAFSALEKSDLVALRCFKSGVEFPQAWKDYVISLRAIVNGGSGPIPDQPTYPQGT